LDKEASRRTTAGVAAQVVEVVLCGEMAKIVNLYLLLAVAVAVAKTVIAIKMLQLAKADEELIAAVAVIVDTLEMAEAVLVAAEAVGMVAPPEFVEAITATSLSTKAQMEFQPAAQVCTEIAAAPGVAVVAVAATQVVAGQTGLTLEMAEVAEATYQGQIKTAARTPTVATVSYRFSNFKSRERINGYRYFISRSCRGTLFS
jgi:hypothetical protein